MSCCNISRVKCIKITAVTIGATTIELEENQEVLANLPVGQMVELVIDPELLPESSLPVVLTDGVTTIPLWMENGNVMRETVFLPFCRRLARCKDNAHVRMRYLADPVHMIVYRARRY